MTGLSEKMQEHVLRKRKFIAMKRFVQEHCGDLRGMRSPLSQAEVAEQAGVSIAYIHRLEKGDIGGMKDNIVAKMLEIYTTLQEQCNAEGDAGVREEGGVQHQPGS